MPLIFVDLADSWVESPKKKVNFRGHGFLQGGPKNIIIKYPKSLEVFGIFDKCESLIWDILFKFPLEKKKTKRYCFSHLQSQFPPKEKKNILVTFTTQKLRSESSSSFKQLPHRIHGDWYIYLHLPWKSTIHVGKYTSPPWIPYMGLSFG